jgi:uncharacterized protein
MHSRFGLTLMVNHACNLRCTYCYTGAKFARRMGEEVGLKAIDRAVASLLPQGTLELGFFGGEPLLEAELISKLIDHAKKRCAGTARLLCGVTTNGTVVTPPAWALMLMHELELAISHDGLPDIHDAHRFYIAGGGTATKVAETMRRLMDAGKEFRVVMVVRPDNQEFVAPGIEFLQALGVKRFDLSLDLWTPWTRDDSMRLEATVMQCARLWRDALPNLSLNWFDEKAALLSHAPVSETARCGFGDGEIAVAPSGRLYPCERLIAEDDPTSEMRLPGSALDGEDFLGFRDAEGRSAAACISCVVQEACNTTCRCSNYIRTGHVGRPDGLLCMFNQACLREAALVLQAPPRGLFTINQSGDYHAHS